MATRTPYRSLSRSGREAEKKAMQTWHDIQETLDAATSRARDVAGETQTKMTDLGRETRRRGRATRDALAGRPAPTPWKWIVIVAVAGVVLGAVANAFGRQVGSFTEEHEPSQ